MINTKGTNTGWPELTLLAHDSISQSLVQHIGRFQVFGRPDRRTAERARSIFVLVSATELPDVSEFVSAANRRQQLRALLVRDDVQPSSIPEMFERAGLRRMRNTIVYSSPSVPRRVLAAWAGRAQDYLIAKASVSRDRLFVLSCSLQRYEVTFDGIAALKGIPVGERARFTVSEDGNCIHWPGPDIHIDLDVVRAALDPIAKYRLTECVRPPHREYRFEDPIRPVEKVEAISYLPTGHRRDVEEYLREVAMLSATA